MYFWLERDGMLRGHTWSPVLFFNFTFPKDIFSWPVLTQCGTSDCIVGHKNTGCSRCKVIPPIICSFFGLADHLLTSAAAVSCSKVHILFSQCFVSVSTRRRVKLFTSFLCLIKHVIVFELDPPQQFHEM